MKLVRYLSLLLAGLLLALPLLSSGGGDNAGGTGVWVLPRQNSAGFLGGIPALSAPRDSKTVSLTGNPLVLGIASDMVNPIATLVDRQTQLGLPLQVLGNFVSIPATSLAQIAAMPGTIADCIILDASARGYLIKITALTTQTLNVEVY